MKTSLRKLYLAIILLLSACQPTQENLEGVEELSPSYPQRIISLSPHLTELIYSLELEHSLVATVEYSDFPEAALDIPRIGNAFQLDWEALTALKPDLILAWQGGNPEAMLTKLEEHGFNVLRLKNAKLFELPLQLQELSELLTGLSTVGESSEYKKTLAHLAEQFSKKQKVRVFYQISSEPIYTVDGQHTISEMLSLCGGENVFEVLGKTSAPVTPEAVLAANPDVILTTTFTRADVIKQWEKVFEPKDILAVSADEVTRASLRMAQGARNICEVLDVWRELP